MDGHQLMVISVDGEPLAPRVLDAFIIHPGGSAVTLRSLSLSLCSPPSFSHSLSRFLCLCCVVLCCVVVVVVGAGFRLVCDKPTVVRLDSQK